MKNHGIEQTVTIGGREYRLSKFTLGLYRQFEAWAKPRLPDPFEDFARRIQGLSPELQRYAWDQASNEARERGNPGTPGMSGLMSSMDGVIQMVYLLLRKYQPDITVAEAETLVNDGIEEYGEGFFPKLFSQAQGEMPASEEDLTASYLENTGTWPRSKKEDDPPDWDRIFASIMREVGYTPDELDAMTLSEIALLGVEAKPEYPTRYWTMARDVYRLSDQDRLRLAHYLWGMGNGQD